MEHTKRLRSVAAPLLCLGVPLSLLACSEPPAADAPSKAGAPVAEASPTPSPTAVADNPAAAPADSPKPVTVELYHDVVCPWCRIGHAHLDAAIAQHGGPVEVVYRPFLLNPDAPEEPRSLKAYLGKKYGADNIDTMFARVTKAGESVGLMFNFSDASTVVASVRAHALLDWAPQAKRAELLAGLHKVYFEDNANIASAKVLGSLAASVGLDATEATAAVADGVRLKHVRKQATSTRAIRGVPYFRIGDQSLRGAQPAAALAKAIAAAALPAD